MTGKKKTQGRLTDQASESGSIQVFCLPNVRLLFLKIVQKIYVSH